MPAKPKFKSDALAAIHASASALQKVGGIDQTTTCMFGASCLAAPVVLDLKQIKKIRERARVSRPVRK